MTRVLITDDHEVVRCGLRNILTSRLQHELVIQEAKDAREAVNFLLSAEFDLILLDISMPGRSGLEVLEEAKRLQPKAPVLIMTSHPEEQFAVRAFKLAMAPIVIALLVATAWLLASALFGKAYAGVSWLLTLACTLIVWRTRIHMLLSLIHI